MCCIGYPHDTRYRIGFRNAVKKAKVEAVKKAMADAGLDDRMVSAFDKADLLKLHAGGYKTSVSFESAREQDLLACGFLPGLIGILCRGARVQGERLCYRDIVCSSMLHVSIIRFNNMQCGSVAWQS